MIQRLIFMAFLFFSYLDSVEPYDDEDSLAVATPQNQEYHDEPQTNLPILDIEALKQPNLKCDSFPSYALNCTVRAALMYNSSRRTPPTPSKITDWCGAIKYLTACAQDWNIDCRDLTDSHFNEESIVGHLYVVNNVCEDENFLAKYDSLTECIGSLSDDWEECYSKFKNQVDEQKNTTREWTHYQTHFQLCCSRAHFRRCTLNLLFKTPKKCTQDQSLTLQKFSVIVSEGDVFQDCDYNMVYSNCPGGDPRPVGTELTDFMDLSLPGRRKNVRSGGDRHFVLISLIFTVTFLWTVGETLYTLMSHGMIPGL